MWSRGDRELQQSTKLLRRINTGEFNTSTDSESELSRKDP